MIKLPPTACMALAKNEREWRQRRWVRDKLARLDGIETLPIDCFNNLVTTIVEQINSWHGQWPYGEPIRFFWSAGEIDPNHNGYACVEFYNGRWWHYTLVGTYF